MAEDEDEDEYASDEDEDEDYADDENNKVTTFKGVHRELCTVAKWLKNDGELMKEKVRRNLSAPNQNIRTETHAG